MDDFAQGLQNWAGYAFGTMVTLTYAFGIAWALAALFRWIH